MIYSRQAEKQNNNCMTYITRSCCLVPLPGPSPAQKSHHKLVRNPEAIPSEACNKNYVDKWLADQLAEKENHWLTEQLAVKLISRVGSIGMGETDKQTKPDIHPTQML